jgi:hypothetical protein
MTSMQKIMSCPPPLVALEHQRQALARPRRSARWILRAKAGVLVVLALVVTGHAQQPAPQRAADVLKEGVTAVLVDVVVRDKRGQPVRDLTAADFDVLEDGVVQTIGSFTSVLEGTGTGGPETPTPAAPTVAVGPRTFQTAGPGVIALVFDRLSPEARRLAVQAAQGYLGTKEEAPDFIGIFGIAEDQCRSAGGDGRAGGGRCAGGRRPRGGRCRGRRTRRGAAGADAVEHDS